MKKKRPPVSAEESRSPVGGPGRREMVLVALVLVVGAALRLVALSRSAVEHFDEGVYASNIYFPPPEYAYPAQRFYAPPLAPMLIETSMTAGLVVGAPANLAALLPGVIAGYATIVALWFVGRSWFSPRTGLAAATLAAISPFHIVYSASALTDVWLGLWLLLAVDAAGRSLVRNDLRWSVAAGLYTGLAWWTKYNGWLPLAIEGAAIALLAAVSWRNGEWPGFGVQGSGGKSRSSGVGCYATTCIVALVAWSPYWFSLQSVGGYGPIAGNHAKYVVGLAGWLTSASRQVAGFSVIDQRLIALGILAAFTLAACVRTAGTKPGPDATRGNAATWPIIAGMLIAGVLLFTAPLLALAVLSGLGLVVVGRELLASQSRQSAMRRSLVGGALLIAWWGGLIVATPCYWPYPRLLLPWLLAAWLAIGVLVDRLFGDGLRDESSGKSSGKSSGESAELPNPFRWNWRLSAAAVGLLLATMPLSRFCRPAENVAKQLGSDRRGVERVARRMHIDLQEQTPSGSTPTALERAGISRIVYVLGEPPLLFQLAAAGEELVRPVEQLPTSAALVQGEPIATFLAVGPHAARDRALQSAWRDHAREWRLVGGYPYRPSAVVWLDLHNPLSSAAEAANADSSERSAHAYRLYEFKPPAPPAESGAAERVPQK